MAARTFSTRPCDHEADASTKTMPVAMTSMVNISAKGSPEQDSATAWERWFDCPAPKRPASFLERAVLWRSQVQASGDVSRSVRHDLQVAVGQITASRTESSVDQDGSILGQQGDTVAAATAQPRSVASRARVALPSASSQLTPGTRLVKHHGGRNHVVEVTADGFVYEGAKFASLSAIAKHITGTHWNGLLFFGLRKRGTYPKRPS